VPIIEQRRDLSLDAENRDRVLIVLDALAMAPDKFMPELGHYLGLRSLYWQLAQAKSDDDLREAVKQMWLTPPCSRTAICPTRRRACATRGSAAQRARTRRQRRELKRLMTSCAPPWTSSSRRSPEEMRKNPQMALRKVLSRNCCSLRIMSPSSSSIDIMSSSPSWPFCPGRAIWRSIICAADRVRRRCRWQRQRFGDA